MKLGSEYESKALGKEYLELLTDLKTVINYGKYSSQVITDSPDWEGTEGETLFRYQVNGTGWFYYQYFWVNSGWSYLRWANSSNALVPDPGSITTDMIQVGAVTTVELKTATSEVTGNTTYANYTLTGGQYCFYPQVKMSSTDAQDWWATICHGNNLTTFAGWTTYATNISLYSGAAGTISAIARYVTASGEDYWLWIWVDKATKDIIGMSGAPDHPAYGNGDDFEAIPHPFRSYNSNTQEIILIEKSQAKAIQLEAKEKGTTVLELVDRDYRIDFSEINKYEPTHSGKFSPEHTPVLVENIPAYIQVRKLRKMTEQDKSNNIKIQEDKQKEFNIKVAIKESSKQIILDKLKITKEDFDILNDNIR